MPLLKNNILFRFPSERAFIATLYLCATLAGIIVFLIFFFLIGESLPAISSLGPHRFLTDKAWYPSEGLYNLLMMLWGSVFAMTGAVALATPLGILSAIFCHFYAPPLIAQCYRQMIQLLAGIPSVVFGFWGLVVLVPLISKLHPPGPSLIAGIFILTFMILPTIALTMDSSFSQVPSPLLQGAAALGLSKWATIRGIVLPTVRSGLLTGVILQTGRAIGETMAILMVSGNIVQLPKSFFDPIRTLTANIALEMAYATGNHRSALFVSGLLLILLVVGLVMIADIFSRKGVYESLPS